MRELKVTQQESNQRLNKYLMRYLNTAPSSFIYKMLRKKNITLNGKKASGDEILFSGDSIKLFLSDETIDKFKDSTPKATRTILNNKESSLKVLYQDMDIMAVHKDAGILSQKATKNDVSINEMIIDYCTENNLIDTSNNVNFKPSICNRLDRNTSGIILAGISLHGTQMLSSILKEKDCTKIYYTIVKGCFDEKLHSKAYIIKDTKENISDIISCLDYNKLDFENKKNFNYIETIFEPVSFCKRFTLLKVHLITGKSHQIRATLKYLNHPIIGDSKYGEENINRYFRDKYKLKHHLLHAGLISFKDITIKDELPDIFLKICKDEHINIFDI